MSNLIIEIGSRSLKLADTSYNGNDIVIDMAYYCENDDVFIKDGRIADTDSFSRLLTESIKAGGLKNRKAVILLDETYIIMKEFTHPKTSPKNLRQLAVFEAENILSVNEKDYVIDCYSYGERFNKDNQYKSILYAVKRDLVIDITGALKKAGLKSVKIVPFIYAYSKIMSKMAKNAFTGQETAVNLAAIDFGSVNTRLVLFSDGRPIFQKLLRSVSQDIDVYISRYLNISAEQARAYKERNGLEQTAENMHNRELYDSILRAFNSMIEEILRTIRITFSSERLELNGIIITGGFSLTPGFCAHISEITGIPCYRSDDINLKAGALIRRRASDRINMQIARLIGISGASLEYEMAEVNLICRDRGRVKTKRKNGGSALFALLVVLILLIFSFIPLLYLREKSINEQYLKYFKRPGYDTAQSQRDELLIKKAELDKKDTIKSELEDSGASVRILDILTKNLPSDMKIGFTSYDAVRKVLTADYYIGNLNSLENYRKTITQDGTLRILNNTDVRKDANSNIYRYRAEIQLADGK